MCVIYNIYYNIGAHNLKYESIDKLVETIITHQNIIDLETRFIQQVWKANVYVITTALPLLFLTRRLCYFNYLALFCDC